MERKTLLVATALLITVAFSSVPAFAGPKLDFGEAAWMKIDLLAQAHYSFLDDAEDEDDFYIRRFRILVNGQIDEGIKVFFQTDYSNAGKQGADSDFTLLDGWVDVRLFGSDHWLKGGLIPLPLSMENRSAVGALLGLDYNSEILKFVNDSTWRDVGAVLQGTFVDRRLGYRVGIFDGYDTSTKNSDADLRFTGRVDFAVIGEVPTGWYVQDTLGGSTYLRIGGGYDHQGDATLVDSKIFDNDVWVLDFQSAYQFNDAFQLTVNGAWFDWDNSKFDGNTAFAEAGLRYNKIIGTLKYTFQDPDEGDELNDYTVGLHYNLKANNLKGGIEYRGGDSDDWWLVGIQFLL
jgi:hypothetical protein